MTCPRAHEAPRAWTLSAPPSPLGPAVLRVVLLIVTALALAFALERRIERYAPPTLGGSTAEEFDANAAAVWAEVPEWARPRYREALARILVLGPGTLEDRAAALEGMTWQDVVDRWGRP